MEEAEEEEREVEEVEDLLGVLPAAGRGHAVRGGAPVWTARATWRSPLASRSRRRRFEVSLGFRAPLPSCGSRFLEFFFLKCHSRIAVNRLQRHVIHLLSSSFAEKNEEPNSC